jgi:hypothetical protein
MTLRVMFDGITPTALPKGGALYAAYVDGNWPFYDQLADLFPDARHVPITNHYSMAATVLDFGEGSATRITDAIDWVQGKRDRGDTPSLYCSASLWSAMVRPSFEAANISPPWWWGAKWDGTTEMFTDPFAVAHQYLSQPGYDESVVKAHWPGVDPEPPAPKPPTPPPPAAHPKEREMIVIREASPTGDVTFGTETVIGLPGGPVHLTTAANVTAVVDALATGAYANITQPDFDSMIKAATPTGSTP